MKQIVITHSFQKNLKKLRRHFTEQDIQNNIKEWGDGDVVSHIAKRSTDGNERVNVKSTE
jgi:hypothetical protein